MDSSDRAYEDFVPPHHMVREPPTHTLSVDLSAAGYKKEHIRVQLVHSHRRLIVRGERPVAGNRWSRFRVEFKLPDDCDTKGIQARFEKGFVRVAMPGLKPEQQVAVDAAGQQKEPNGAASGVQDAAPAPPTGRGEELEKDQDRTKVQKQEADQQRVKSSAKHGGRDDDDNDAASEGGAAPSSCQGYAFLRDRKKAATTVLGVVLVLFSLGIYVRYSLAP